MEERTCPACGVNQKRQLVELRPGRSVEAWVHVNNQSVDCDPSLVQISMNPVEFPIHPPHMNGTDITRDIDSK